MTKTLTCERCGDTSLDVVPVAVAITTGSKNLPWTCQRNFCILCRADLKHKALSVLDDVREIVR